MITTKKEKEKDKMGKRKKGTRFLPQTEQGVDVAQGFAVLPLPSSATFGLIAE